jgi:hypothetical protein
MDHFGEKVGIRPRFIENSSPPASMDGWSNSTGVAIEKVLRSYEALTLGGCGGLSHGGDDVGHGDASFCC